MEKKWSKLDEKISRRVLAFLKKAGLKKKPFALSVGIDDAHFRALTSGRAGWKTWHMEAVAGGLGISPADLIEDRPTQLILKDAPSLSVQTVPRFETFHETFAPNNYVPIRLVEGAAAAGPPSEVLESEISSWVLIYASREWMPHDPENYTCVRVKGRACTRSSPTGHRGRGPCGERSGASGRQDGGVPCQWGGHHQVAQISQGQGGRGRDPREQGCPGPRGDAGG